MFIDQTCLLSTVPLLQRVSGCLFIELVCSALTATSIACKWLFNIDQICLLITVPLFATSAASRWLFIDQICLLSTICHFYSE
jgi:hypothetical protein